MTDQLKPGCFGVHVFEGHNPMPAPCVDCPFVLAAKGMDYLAPGRLDDIKFAVSMGQAFYCHKHVYKKGVEMRVDPETGDLDAPSFDRSYRQCAGAIAYAKALKKEIESGDAN